MNSTPLYQNNGNAADMKYSSFLSSMTQCKQEQQQQQQPELAQYQDICNAPPSTTSPDDEESLSPPPCKSIIQDYEEHCMFVVQTQRELVKRLSNELNIALDGCLRGDQNLYDSNEMLNKANTEETNQENLALESNANLRRCDAELAQAVLERDASQSLVECISKNRASNGGGIRDGTAARKQINAHKSSIPSPYVIARKKRLGIKMLSTRYMRGAPSGDVHKAFISDLREFLMESEGRELVNQQIDGYRVDIYRLFAEVLQAGGIEVVIQTNYGLRNIANRLRIGNKILSGGRSSVDEQMKAIYLDTLYRYEQLLCLGRIVGGAKVELLMAAGPVVDEDMI